MRDHNDDDIRNASHNRPFREVLGAKLSRRAVLRGGLSAAAAAFFATPCAIAVAQGARPTGRALIGFEPLPSAKGSGPWPNISADYQWDVLLAWGDPLDPDGPARRHPPDPVDQTVQIGIGHDGMWYFPIRYPNLPRGGWDDAEWVDGDDWYMNAGRGRLGNTRGMLAINHEFGRNAHVLGKPAPTSLNDVRVSQHAHGVSVVEIVKTQGRWAIVRSTNARRIHANTPMQFAGPVAGHPLLRNAAGNSPQGTLNNCASGYTPWGTYLTCEENFDGYFGASRRGGRWIPGAEHERYGFSDTDFGYGWYEFDHRFDLSEPGFANEVNRFGWVVEIDPMDAQQIPVKRTALGRFRHEGVALTVGRDGRVVGYMGDDQHFEYIYKFVSDGHWKEMRRAGLSPLDHGRLYVARFDDDGSGRWLELTVRNPALADVFPDQAAVLTFARMAADIVGATPMDRPEWTTVAPGGEVYCTLTNNERRSSANAANPRAPNPDGHIIRWRDSDEHLGETFTWDIFMLAADTRGTEQVFSSPDGLLADPDGRLFIQTDGNRLKGMNNQLLVADVRTGELRRLFSGVAGDEVTGLALTPDRRTLFINLQHPGNGDPKVTNFPAARDGTTVPRDATLVITRRDGGIIGS